MGYAYDVLARSALRSGDLSALEIIGAELLRLTFRELKQEVDDLADFMGSSLSPTDIVGIQTPSHKIQFLSILALDKLNVPSVVLHQHATAEFRWITKILSGSENGADMVSIVSNGATGSRQFGSPTAGIPSAKRLARVLFTSGITGRPKAVGFSNEIIANRVVEYQRHFGGLFDEGGELLSLMGLASSLGYLGLCFTLNHGHCYVVLDGSAPLPTGHEKRRFSVVSSTPATLAEYWALHKNGAPVPFTARNTIVSGGVVAQYLCDEMKSVFETRMYSLFGSTETGLIAFAPVDALDLDAGEVGIMRDTCRLIQGDGDKRSVRFETDYIAPYLDDDVDATQPVQISGNWTSNDMCRLLPSGVLKFEGRTSDIVNSGGVKMALAEIESRVGQFPNVDQVCALRLPDALGIERVLLVLKPGSKLDRNAFAQQYRDVFPSPLFPIRFIELDKFPMTASGKVDRSKLLRFVAKNL